jgi:hypothetical protein
VYFYEYGRFMLPFRPHHSSVLPGNNVTYKRADVIAALTTAPEGFFDVFVHEAWDRAGQRLQITPSIVVTNVNSWPASHVTSAPFHHGRGFAAQRVKGRRLRDRVAMAAVTPLLPAVQIFRIMRDTMRRKRLRGRLFSSVPWLALFATSWAAGECVGYLCGAGRSLDRWR